MTEPLGSMRRFEGKVAVVTGAASGIGAAAAERFLAEGAFVAGCDVNGDALADRFAQFGVPGDRVLTQAVDVADSAALAAFIHAAAVRFGAIDVLVNNAGIGSFGRADELPVEAWDRVLAINLGAAFHGSRAALPYLRKSHGCIVNTASISGLFADPGLLAYNVSKAAVVNLTRNMAVDHAAEGIRVNCICPGPVGTPMLAPLLADPGVTAQYATLIPLGRVGTAEEMAAAILFLASRDAAFITGTAMVIDGGVTCQTGQPNLDRILRAIVPPGAGG
jgi:meso-butanediol dehydrogenase/(S,S)-butanediol dehydrogenase/diacetyl reductase